MAKAVKVTETKKETPEERSARLAIELGAKPEPVAGPDTSLPVVQHQVAPRSSGAMKKPILPLPEGFDTNRSTSAQIRDLKSRGWDNGDIARSLGKIYQHVRNVLTHPVKKPQ